MARLRYNGLKTTLSGAHNDTTTTLNFGAALTYAGGSNVPTIASPDYLPLIILNSAGDMAEIVYVTAYTTGTTSATVTRGQEGSTAVSHSSGVRAVHGPTAVDFNGGMVAFATATRTSGDISFNTATIQNVDTALDLTLTGVKAGDLIEYIPNFVTGSANNTFNFDVCTLVGGSPVNYFSTGTGSPAGNGVAGWRSSASDDDPLGAPAFYTLQAGDISSGSVTLRLRITPATTTARVISANSSTPMKVAARAWRV